MVFLIQRDKRCFMMQNCKYLVVTFFVIASLFVVACNQSRIVFDVEIEESVAVFMFMDENQCLGCSTFMMDCFRLLNIQKDLQTTAIVNCKREIQLKKFDETYNWNSLSIVDKNYKKKYNLDPATVVVLAFKDSEDLIEFAEDDYQAIEEIKSYIRMVQNETH